MPDRTEVDLLYEILLKLGLDLCVPIETREITGKTVYSIGGGVLMACLDKKIIADDVEELGLTLESNTEQCASPNRYSSVFHSGR